ncbi:MAG: hypothetical protein OEU92_13785 [Alphaproteobacteria bacterium]|nr:hypothetical protein [Alphaproteobacteria bacterium]
MLRTGAISLLMLGTLSACGHTPEERLASGALIGGAIGAVVGLASEPGYHGYDDSDRYYRPRRHDNGDWRRHRDYDDDYYDD